MNYYKDRLEEAIRDNNKRKIDQGNRTLEIIDLKSKEDNYIKTIQDLNIKLKYREEMEKHYKDNLDDARAVVSELESSNYSQSYNEVKLHNELEEARTTIDQLRTNEKNISTKNQPARDNEIEEQTKNYTENLSLLWDNSADLGQQKEVTNPLIPQKDPKNTNETEGTNIYENQSQISQIADQDNNKNESIENISKAKAANVAEMNMTLRSMEKLNPPTYLKDYITE